MTNTCYDYIKRQQRQRQEHLKKLAKAIKDAAQTCNYDLLRAKHPIGPGMKSTPQSERANNLAKQRLLTVLYLRHQYIERYGKFPDKEVLKEELFTLHEAHQQRYMRTDIFDCLEFYDFIVQDGLGFIELTELKPLFRRQPEILAHFETAHEKHDGRYVPVPPESQIDFKYFPEEDPEPISSSCSSEIDHCPDDVTLESNDTHFSYSHSVAKVC